MSFGNYNALQVVAGNYQLSATGGVVHTVTTISGSTGFVNVYDARNGLPLAASERIVASGVTTTAGSTLTLDAQLNSGLYVQAFGGANVVVSWR